MRKTQQLQQLQLMTCDIGTAVPVSHLHQHLVDDACTLVTSSSSTTGSTQRIKLVDEQHGGREVTEHLERLADATRANARVHVVEVRTCRQAVEILSVKAQERERCF